MIYVIALNIHALSYQHISSQIICAISNLADVNSDWKLLLHCLCFCICSSQYLLFEELLTSPCDEQKDCKHCYMICQGFPCKLGVFCLHIGHEWHWFLCVKPLCTLHTPNSCYPMGVNTHMVMRIVHPTQKMYTYHP